MFSFLHKINPKKRDSSTVSSVSTTTTSRHTDLVNDFQHINDIKNDLLPTSIEFTPDLILPSTHFPNGKKSTGNNINKKSSPSSSSHASTVNDIIMTASTTSSSKESTSSSKLLPFGKNNPFSRKSSHMSSLASLGSGYFTTGRLKNKSSSSSASLGTLATYTSLYY